MPVIEDLTVENLKQFGIAGFSFTMPATTQKWVDQNSDTPGVTFNASDLSLSYTSNNWLAIFSGILNEVNAGSKKIKFSLQKANGNMVNEAGALLRLFPQQILKMKRLVALKMEDDTTHNPLRSLGETKRQIPAFVFIASTGATGMTSGYIAAGEDIGFGGTVSFYDEQGLIIHPLYVASLVKSLLTIYPALDVDTSNSLNNQLAHIAGLSAASSTVRIVKPDGKPYAGEHLEGITVVNSSIGLFTLNSHSGTDTTLKGEIKRSAATAESGDFPPLDAQQLLIANATYGRFLDAVPLIKFPTALASNTPTHDFFTVKILETRTYLLGEPDEDYNGTKLEPRPLLRLHEPLQLLSTGNHIMGRLQSIFSGSPTEALVAATTIDTTLPLPADEVNVLWPAFPALPSTAGTPDNTLPAGLKDEITRNSRADFVPASGGAQPTDVVLKLTGIPVGAAVRVFNREFLADAVEKRGDGAGGVCLAAVPPFTGRTLNGELSLLLKDPLNLKRPDGTITVPTDPKLIFDLMLNLNDGNTRRLFGAITLPVQTTTPTLPTTSPNILNGVGRKGVSHSAILGLNTFSITATDFSSIAAFLNMALALTGEPQPRDASRLPTMARRDMLAAALKSGAWQSLISGGQISGNLHNAMQDRGSPGTPGGKETSNVGVYTQNGRIAYDIARMAFRRTTNFYERLTQLISSNWNEPSALTALAENAVPSINNGLFAGAVLQNIAPACETPELALLKSVVETNINSIPETFDDLVDELVTWINNINTSSLTGLLQTAANRLKTTVVTQLNNLKDNNALSESDKERLYNEVKRELSASCFGRRDSAWALQKAIQQARHFIYIETPGFSFTKGTANGDYAVDLIAELTTQLTAKPGLRVIICVPRQPDYQRGYDQWIKSELKERFEIIKNLPDKQVVVFHPIGFPGRPSNLEQNVVIVDDVWALIGSSAFRRRGLSFDGSSDLVFTNFDQVNGNSTPIQSLRLSLLKQRLGIPESDNGSSRALQLKNIQTTFQLIRQQLLAGGLGKIEKLYSGLDLAITHSGVVHSVADNNTATPSLTMEVASSGVWSTGNKVRIGEIDATVQSVTTSGGADVLQVERSDSSNINVAAGAIIYKLNESGLATINRELANPDGVEFNGLSASVFTAFTSLAK